MGMFDWLTGSAPPPPGVTRRPAADLRAALLAIDRPTAPFQVRDGTPEGVDLVAEWRIVDARWYEIFARAGIERVFQVLMRLDEAACEVRAVDREWRVDWRAGVPELHLAKAGFRGQTWKVGFGTAYAFREDLSWGQTYDFRFDTREIKQPLRQAALAAGWGWRGVVFGTL